MPGGGIREGSERMITIYGRAIVDGAHQGFARARFRYRDFSEGDSFDGRRCFHTSYR